VGAPSRRQTGRTTCRASPMRPRDFLWHPSGVLLPSGCSAIRLRVKEIVKRFHVAQYATRHIICALAMPTAVAALLAGRSWRARYGNAGRSLNHRNHQTKGVSLDLPAPQESVAPSRTYGCPVSQSFATVMVDPTVRNWHLSADLAMSAI